MPLVVPAKPPDPASYGRVLRRYDRDPGLPIRFSGYDVSIVSKPIEAHGRVAPTLFFPKGKEAAAQRATRLGWRDETESFAAHVRGEPDPLGVRPAPPETRAPQAPEPPRAPVSAGPAPLDESDTPTAMHLPGLTRVAKRTPKAVR